MGQDFFPRQKTPPKTRNCKLRSEAAELSKVFSGQKVARQESPSDEALLDVQPIAGAKLQQKSSSPKLHKIHRLNNDLDTSERLQNVWKVWVQGSIGSSNSVLRPDQLKTHTGLSDTALRSFCAPPRVSLSPQTPVSHVLRMESRLAQRRPNCQHPK